MLFGRADHLARLSRADAPVVTLVGPGGAGKTRLAREHASTLSHAVFVDLASARSRRDAIAAFAAALGIELDDAEDAASVTHAAAAQQALIVADNVEQLEREARDVVVAIARGGARVLATSRERLGIDIEEPIDVGPLGEEDAIALFERLAPGVCDRDTALAIVTRVDKLPLAIELAAARAALLGGKELLARLDRKLDVLASATRRELPARHATLRATIAWSWDLLDETDRSALRALASFEALFDAPLALAVVEAPEEDALAALERLVAQSLVQRVDRGTRPTFRLLEAVRDFAREQAAASDLSARYAGAILARAEPLAEQLENGADTVAPLSTLRGDLAAIADARAGDHDATHVARATLALAALLAVIGPATEIDRLVTAVLDRTADRARKARLLVARAFARRASGALDGTLADVDAARALLEGEQDRDARLLDADALRVAAAANRTLGRTTEALAALDQALATYRELGARAREGLALDELGAVHQAEGRLALARTRHEEAIAIHVATGSRRAEGRSRSHRAVAMHRAGAVEEATRAHVEALAIHRAVGHRRLEGAELLHLGYVHGERGTPGAASGFFDDARKVLAAAGARDLEALAFVLDARSLLNRDFLDAARAALARADASGKGASWPRLSATSDVVHGHLAMAERRFADAARWYASALAKSETVVVGFEALTPAYLALARLRAGEPLDPSLFERARAAVSRFENPSLAIALGLLEAGARGEKILTDRVAASRSCEVRRALVFIDAHTTLRIANGGTWIGLPDGREVDLRRRKNLPAIVFTLGEARRDRPGEPVAAESLLAAGWPGEKMKAEAATKRLHTAIWTLRSLGLEDVLRTAEDGSGYFLDPSVPTEIWLSPS